MAKGSSIHPKIMPCTCRRKHEFQDEKYGGNRVWNRAERKKDRTFRYICTVCGEKTAPQNMKEEKKKGEGDED